MDASIKSPSLPARAWSAFCSALSFSNAPSKIRGWRFVAMLCGAGFLLFSMAYQSYLAKAFRSVGDEGAATVALAQSGLSSLAAANAAALRFGVAGAEKEAAAASAQAANARRFLIRAAADAGKSPSALSLAEQASDALAAWEAAWARQRMAPSPGASRQTQEAYDKATLGFARLTENGAARMEAAYKAHPGNRWGSALGAGICALATAVALLNLQLEMLRASNRALNPGALGATLAFCAFFAIGSFVAASAESSLRSAKSEAFGSSVTLWATQASLQEARALRAKIAANPTPELAQEWERISTGILMSGQDADAPLLGEKDFLRAGTGAHGSAVAAALGAGPSDVVRFGGLLGRALDEASYPGEREALASASAAFARYGESFKAVDAQSQSLGARGFGDEEAFAKALQGVERALDVNQRAFANEVATSQARLGLIPWVGVFLGLLGALGCYFGTKARLDEYRF